MVMSWYHMGIRQGVYWGADGEKLGTGGVIQGAGDKSRVAGGLSWGAGGIS